MNIKTLGVLIGLAFGEAVQAERPEEILTDFQAKAGAASERLDETLRRQGTVIAASLVVSGDSVGAATVSEQIERKIAGEGVPQPHVKLSRLLVQYDAARNAQLMPLQEASIKRLEALLKTSAASNMSEVLKIAKAHEDIEHGRRTPTKPRG